MGHSCSIQRLTSVWDLKYFSFNTLSQTFLDIFFTNTFEIWQWLVCYQCSTLKLPKFCFLEIRRSEEKSCLAGRKYVRATLDIFW